MYRDLFFEQSDISSLLAQLRNAPNRTVKPNANSRRLDTSNRSFSADPSIPRFYLKSRPTLYAPQGGIFLGGGELI